jgi:signal transduction histidine kinase
MRQFFRRLRPDHLAGQISAIILATILVFHFALTTVQHFQSPGQRPHFVEPYETLSAAVVAVDAAPIDARGETIAALATSAPWAKLQLEDAPPPARSAPDSADDLGEFAQRLWPDAKIYGFEGPGAFRESDVVVGLRKGGYLRVSTLAPRRPAWPGYAPSWPRRIVERTALFFIVCATLLTIWVSRTVVAPLARLAREAERFPDESCECAPLIEAGPREVRDLTRAVNRMQARIQTMIAARNQALAAISHDLRTIITRIKLRSEFIGDEALQAKMRADADLMDAMLVKNLHHLRDGHPLPARGAVDIDSVLHTVVDQFADLGHDVRYEGGAHHRVLGSLTELQRIFTNLVENAVAHATSVAVTLTQTSSKLVQIDVVDDGPGISREDKARMLEPFVRGEPARTMTERSGFGLGLSIVRSLVQECGGAFELLDREPHGLIARVTLPCAPGMECPSRGST